jgi:4-azaleucine resistance transporter AzlC
MMRVNKDNMFTQGLQAGWPICLGYIPIGLAFGVLAQKAGLSPLHIGLMSALVFAGSAQFIAVSMLAAGASATAIILTTFVVNLRHVLMSTACTDEFIIGSTSQRRIAIQVVPLGLRGHR